VRHGAGLADEIAGFHRARGESLGCLEEELLADIGQPLRLAGETPVVDELELDVADAVVIEDAPHVLEAKRAQGMFEVRVPDADAGESYPRGRLHALTKSDGAVLVVRMRLGPDGECPIGRKQIDGVGHDGILRGLERGGTGCTPPRAAP
jgi:hypothetical protein